jgi:hypothetical protein
VTEQWDIQQKATANDEVRPVVRIFLAASQDLEEERGHFEELIHRLAELPGIARQFRLQPVHWQQGGGDTEGRTVQQQIEKSVEFDEIAIVLVLVGAYLGPGTRAEYDDAKALRMRHGSWPKLLVFFKSNEDGVSLIGDESVLAFHRRIIEDRLAVPTNFRNEAELEQRLADQLGKILLSSVRSDRLGGEKLRRAFLGSATLCVALSLVLLIATRTMAFPVNGVTYNKILFILFGPPVLFIVSIVTSWVLLRLINEFSFAWNSANYADERIYSVFRHVFPRMVIPQPLQERFRRDALGDTLSLGLLLLVFVTPLAAQYNCVFSGLLTWDFVVAPDVLAGDPAPKDSTRDNPVRSRYVEKGPLTWPYTLKTIPETDANGRALTGPIYVYSRSGTLGDPADSKFGREDAFRMNIGPEVFPLWQPLIYVHLIAIQALVAVVLLGRVAMLGRLVKRMHFDIGAGGRRAPSA